MWKEGWEISKTMAKGGCLGATLGLLFVVIVVVLVLELITLVSHWGR
jgi:hypothetical protein